MDKHHIKIRGFICLIFFFSLLWGCDQKSETPQQIKKVTKKIAVAKKDESKPAPPKKTEVPKPEPKKEVVKEIATAKPKVTPNTSMTKPGGSEKKPDTTVIKEVQTIKLSGINDIYNPKGKLDPFEPLFKAKRIALATKKIRRRRAPRTPLEKVSLSQLKLVAIIRTTNENKALVQEATGKGYIVKKGAYIGLNSGKIVQILKDRIIIEEEVEDVYGKTTVSKETLNLQKPPGE